VKVTLLPPHRDHIPWMDMMHGAAVPMAGESNPCGDRRNQEDRECWGCVLLELDAWIVHALASVASSSFPSSVVPLCVDVFLFYLQVATHNSDSSTSKVTHRPPYHRTDWITAEPTACSRVAGVRRTNVARNRRTVLSLLRARRSWTSTSLGAASRPLVAEVTTVSSTCEHVI